MPKRPFRPMPAWFVPGNGDYLCHDHEAQFRTVGAYHAHCRTEHPERIKHDRATPEEMARGMAMLQGLRG